MNAAQTETEQEVRRLRRVNVLMSDEEWRRFKLVVEEGRGRETRTTRTAVFMRSLAIPFMEERYKQMRERLTKDGN